MKEVLVRTLGRLFGGAGIALSLAFVAASLKYILLKREANRLAAYFPYCKKSEVFLLGHFYGFLKNSATFFRYREKLYHAVAKQNPSLCQDDRIKTIQVIPLFCMGVPTTLMTQDPEIIKHISKDHFNNWVRQDAYRNASKVTSKNAIFFVNHGDHFPEEHEVWQYQRKVAVSIFTKNAFNNRVRRSIEKNLTKIFRNIDSQFDKNSNESGEIELKKQIYSFTLDTISEFVLDVELNTLDYELLDQQLPPFAEAFDRAVVLSRERLFSFGFRLFGNAWPISRQLQHTIKTIRKFTLNIIKNRKKPENIDQVENGDDILSRFIRYQQQSNESLGSKNGGYILTDDFLHDVVASFMLAGRDTTAASITWTLYLLAAHPEVQTKVFGEIQRMIGLGTVDADNVKKLGYLDATLSEVFRIFPPVPLNTKEAACEDDLPNGVRLQKGSVVAMDVLLMGRDPNRYPEPHVFKPERWLNKELDEFSFPIFSGGYGMCIGRQLALYETKHVLIEFLRRYTVHIPDNVATGIDKKDLTLLFGKPIYEVSLTLNFKGPMNLTISKRNA